MNDQEITQAALQQLRQEMVLIAHGQQMVNHGQKEMNDNVVLALKALAEGLAQLLAEVKAIKENTQKPLGPWPGDHS